MFDSIENPSFGKTFKSLVAISSIAICTSQITHDVTSYFTLQSSIKPLTSIYTSEQEEQTLINYKTENFTAKEIITWLREGGLPMAVIADIVNVERKTVYTWMNGGPAKENNLKRLIDIQALLSEDKQETDLRSLYRLWNRKINDQSLKMLFLQDNLDVSVIRQTLRVLWPIAKKYMETEKKLSNTDIRKNPILNEIPEASIFSDTRK